MACRFDFASLVPLGLEVDSVDDGENVLVVTARSKAATASCLLCGVVSHRVQSHYVRQPSDLPCAGRRVRLRLLVRRFRCGVPGCLWEVFAERFDTAVLAERARRTGRLEEIVHHLGLAMGGRPGAGFAQRLMLPVSNDTLLRVVRRRALPRAEKLAVIGIDDWAFRRNHRYGTIICDLERRRVVALLPDREQATAEVWLRQHSEISIVSRDRGGGYGEAVARALPDTIQVADRWHLMENAAFLEAVRLSMRAVRSALGAARIEPALLTAAERLQYEGFLRREDTTRQILASLVERFQAIIRTKAASELDGWIEKARTSLIAPLARGVVKDVAAIRAAITEPWSNGQTEGQITRLKLVKRQMYGRAKLDLLEARLIGAA